MGNTLTDIAARCAFGSVTVYDFECTTIDGQPQALEVYRGQVLLIVNVASECGFTPQYEGLETLYRRYNDRGFAVLGFPCDQFGNQEPGTEEQIKKFCTNRYDVTFPMFAKVAVNGSGTHPLFRFLKENGKGLLGSKAIKWNFTKFLISRTGAVHKRYGPKVTPRAIEPDLQQLLD